MLELAQSSLVCPHYTRDGQELEKTVIIGPIRIFEETRGEGQTSYDLVIGCSLFQFCENKNCAYSWVSRMERKKKPVGSRED
jgi:hypothetical protein